MKIEDLNNATLLYSQFNGLNGVSGGDFEKSLDEARAALDRLGEGLNGGTKSLEEMLSGKNSVNDFRAKLSSVGAVAFMAEFNAAKIDEKLAAKRDELIKELGLDEQSVISKSKDEIKQLNDVLNQRLAAYKRELLAGSFNNTLYQKQQNLSSTKSSNSTLSSVLSLLN